MKTILSIMIVLFIATGCGGFEVPETSNVSTNSTSTTLNQQKNDSLAAISGNDILLHDSIIMSISSYSPNAPVYAASNYNGWLVSGTPSAEVLSGSMLAKETTGTFVGWWRVKNLKGTRFNIVQLKDNNFSQNSLNWGMIQKFSPAKWIINNLAILVTEDDLNLTNVYTDRNAIPEDAGHLSIFQVNFVTPPYTYNAVNGWFVSATLIKGQTSTGYVMVDWVEVIEEDETSERVIFREDYNQASSYFTKGGLFERYPTWFGTNDARNQMSNAFISNGYLTVKTGEQAENVSHWWLGTIPCKPNCKYFLRANVKISGSIGLLMGADYFKETTSVFPDNTEAWISGWYGDTSGQFKTIEFSY